MFDRLLPSRKRILMYHRILPDDTPTFVFEALSGEVVSQSVFQAQLKWLCTRFTPMPLAELLACRDREPCFSVTFDDGLVDNLRYALPVLQSLKIPATIFVLAAKVGSGEALAHHQAARKLAADPGAAPDVRERPKVQVRQYLESSAQALEAVHPDDRFLEADELRQLVLAGVSIQSHGLSHTPLAALSASAIQAELKESRRLLQDMTDQPVDYFAYPIGREAHLIDGGIVKANGYQAAFTAIPGRPRRSTDPFRLPRFGARNSLAQLQKKI